MPGAGFPIDLLFTVKGDLTPLNEVDKKIKQLGMGLRLTGRDMMRLGGALDKVFTRWLSSIGKVFQGSLLWEAGLEDISWALEDVGSVLGDYFAPLLEWVANIIESFAEALEANPLLFWLTVIAIGIVVIGKLVSMILSFVGSMNLYVGTLMIAKGAHLGFGATLKAFYINLTEGKKAMLEYVAGIKGLAYGAQGTAMSLAAQVQALKAQRRDLLLNKSALESYRKTLFQNGQVLPQNAEKLKLVDEALTKNKIALTKNDVQLGVATKKEEKYRKITEGVKQGQQAAGEQTKSWTDRLKGGLKTLTKFAAGGVLLGAVGGFLIANWEPLQDLMSTIGETLVSLFEPLAPLIEGFTNWIEENPELAKTLLAIIIAVAAAIVLLPKLGGIIDMLGKGFKSLTDKISGTVSPTEKATEGSWKATLANAALVASVAALVVALTYFFSTMSSMGVSVWEAVGALAAVLVAILGFMTGLTLITKSLGEVQSSIWMGVAAMAAMVGICLLLAWGITQLLIPLMQLPGGIANLYLFSGALLLLMAGLAGIAILLGSFGAVAVIGAVVMGILAAAALALGAACLIAGQGIMMAATGLLMMSSNLGGLAPLVPILLGLGVSLLALGLAALVSFAPLFLLAAAVTVLAVAFLALAAALNAIPDWARGFVGGIVGFFGGLFGGLPHLQEGGIIEEGGVAVLHPGEEVIPAAEAKKRKEKAIAPPVTININAPIGSREIAESFADEISKIFDRKFERSR